MPLDGRGRHTTATVEDYVKSIYHLGGSDHPVATTDLADRLSVSAAGTSHKLRQLSQLGLVEHVPYHGVRLTSAGVRAALEVIRHHRLAEQFLVEILNYTWDEVHDDAELLEHVMSERLEARIAAKLGNPAHDPHGEPIPTPTGHVAQTPPQRLIDLPQGAKARIRQVNDRDPAKLRYLAQLGLIPGAELIVLHRGPFREPLRVLISGQEHVISLELAAELGVEQPLFPRTSA
ncbi:MAG: metal-dependent transcriptional regulator [Chloroflexi bacterium]|nr:metal-dependent transcriptional regulator [Chloroflexota bacterium]